MADVTLTFERSAIPKLSATMSKTLSRDFHILITSEYFLDWIEDGMSEVNASLDIHSIRVSVDDPNINELCKSHTTTSATPRAVAKIGKFSKTLPTLEILDFQKIAEQFRC